MNDSESSTISKFLENLDCCQSCILIFRGDFSAEKISATGTDDKLTPDNENSESVESNNFSNSVHKKRKEFICSSCLGLLQNSTSAQTIDQMLVDLKENEFDTDQFYLSISLPVCIGLRTHAIWARLLQEFPSVDIQARTSHLMVLKDVWKCRFGSRIAKGINKEVTGARNIPFSITVYFTYTADDEECHTLEKLDEERFSIRRKQHKKFAEGVFTKQAVEKTLANFTDEQFLRICKDHPPTPPEPLAYQRIHCSHDPFYLAGRYNKYSRELPQTPWLVDEVRRFDCSVQELICDPLQREIKADGYKFSASGREDVDVRCLGMGRPFVVEFLNPRRTRLTPDHTATFQKSINAATTLVSVQDLQVVLKKDVCNLKEGEEEKTKSYSALCFSREPIPDEQLKKVDGIRDLTLHQTTPLRVLHRRPLATRNRVVHKTHVERIDQHFFKMYLNTQAGTYVKEFIHGDFGRTNPNVRSMLGLKCDIIALDVENVQLDWPPYTNHREKDITK